MTTLTRRNRTEQAEPEEERPTRRGRGRGRPSDDMPTEERNDQPRARSRRGGSRDTAEETPRRGRRDSKPSAHKTGLRGTSAYASKRRETSAFSEEFRPEENTKTLIKFLEFDMFDSYNQHWIEEGDAAGKVRHSFVCFDDEYFEDKPHFKDGCPLCDVGDNAVTYSLWNIVDLSAPRTAKAAIWKTSAAVTDKLLRISDSKRTSPLNRDDLYFEVEKVKKGRRINWEISPISEDDVADDYGDDYLLEDDELEGFLEKVKDDRSEITQVDTWEALDTLAESL